MSALRTLVSCPRAAPRLERAGAWLAARSASERVLVLASSHRAGMDLLRTAAARRGASFGWRVASLDRLALELAAPQLAREGLVPASSLAVEAVCARVVAELDASELGRFAAIADAPGLPAALGRTLLELRLAGADAAELPGALHGLSEAYSRALATAGLVDRPELLARAVQALPTVADRPGLDCPLLLLDLPVEHHLEAQLLEAIVARSPEVLATVLSGDEASCAALQGLLGAEVEALPVPESESGGLARLQSGLFDAGSGESSDRSDEVLVLSAPGEGRECVEIARRLHREARAGRPFDRMAVLLRSPSLYQAHVEEALRRAGIPAWLAEGSRRPDPGGRALLALLGCALEGLSARRFSEYLSLGELPRSESGDPALHGALEAGSRWLAGEELLTPGETATPSEEQLEPSSSQPELPAQPPGRPVPRRWELLLEEAAVLGGLSRWRGRLAALREELETELEGASGAAQAACSRRLREVEALQAFALPLVEELAALPERASWGDWLEHLAGISGRALRKPDRVLELLGALKPMATTGPVGLREVHRVLARRLTELPTRSAGRRFGKVFVGPIEAARGRSFEVVFVPGLAERLFPQKVVEDPILLDSERRLLPVRLQQSEDRVAEERTRLRLAVGAASQKLVLSWPRLDGVQGRPRVPSFYGLEVLRAAEGSLPGFDELVRRANEESLSRMAWPAPADPDEAIDEAEHDLAQFASVRRQSQEQAAGTLRYLLDSNPFLARSLRSRFARWSIHSRFTSADGLVSPRPEGLEALASHRLQSRSFSATALQDFVTCPYRFALRTIHRLKPWERAAPLDSLDPMNRGSLIHEVQFQLHGSLRDAGELPVTATNLAAARAALDSTLDAVAARYEQDLAPTSSKGWSDSIEAIRADLAEWLRRCVQETEWVPHRFELGFGVPLSDGLDPASQEEPARLDCGLALRGAIDLVERRADGGLRVTDYKTGRARVPSGAIVDGGRALQPVLYALAAEKLAEGAPVHSGRLYYCTSGGGFRAVEVPLAEPARRAAQRLATVVGSRIENGNLPQAPHEGACQYCDFTAVCGPHEEARVNEQKPAAGIADLVGLRSLR